MRRRLKLYSIKQDWNASRHKDRGGEILYGVSRSLFSIHVHGKPVERMKQLIRCYFSRTNPDNTEEAIKNFEDPQILISKWHLEQDAEDFAEALGMKDMLLDILNVDYPEEPDYKMLKQEELPELYEFIKRATKKDCAAQAYNNRNPNYRDPRASYLLPVFDEAEPPEDSLK